MSGHRRTFLVIDWLIAVPFVCAIGVFASWQRDNAILRQQSVEITAKLNTDSARIQAISDWVYHHKGFGKNSNHFIFPALGPTPVQVLEEGGDCADKSRLVAAMLNELNIEAGLVMIAPCPHCWFIHTVVEARTEHGRMVVDPVWNVDYPTAEGQFLGVRDLAGTSLGRQRIAALQQQRGAADKIVFMPATEATFDYAVALNWDKHIGTRVVGQTLRMLGFSPESMFRPRFLEDPKLALVLLLIGIGIADITLRLLWIYRAVLVIMIPRRQTVSIHGFARPSRTAIPARNNNALTRAKRSLGKQRVRSRAPANRSPVGRCATQRLRARPNRQ